MTPPSTNLGSTHFFIGSAPPSLPVTPLAATLGSTPPFFSRQKYCYYSYLPHLYSSKSSSIALCQCTSPSHPATACFNLLYLSPQTHTLVQSTVFTCPNNFKPFRSTQSLFFFLPNPLPFTSSFLQLSILVTSPKLQYNGCIALRPYHD